MATGVPVPACHRPWSSLLWADVTAARAATVAARALPQLTLDEMLGGVQAADAWLLHCVRAAPTAEHVQARLSRLADYMQVLEGGPPDDEGAVWMELRARVAVLRTTCIALAEALDGWDESRAHSVAMLAQGTVDEVNFRTTLDAAPIGVLRYAAALAIATGHKSRMASIGRALGRREQAAAA